MNSKHAAFAVRPTLESLIRGGARCCLLLLAAALISVTLAPLAPKASAQLDGPSLSSFTNPTRTRFKPLSLKEAFPYHLSVAATDLYRINWEPAPEHYLYQHKFKFSYQQDPASAPQLLEVELPAGVEKQDEFFGDVEVYFSKLTIDLPLPELPAAESTIIIEFQGCAEWGFCYPPQKVSIPLN